MRRPLVLTGGPAVGKTTCGRALADNADRAAFIDVDDVRQLVVSGAEAPWDGPEGRAQHALGAVHASALARNFVEHGFDVVIADVLTPTTARLYRALLPDCLIVHLRISLERARHRARTRTVYLTDAEFELLHQEDHADPPESDAVLVVDELRVEDQLEAIREIWEGR